MARPETQFWQHWKKNTPNIIWTRIENITSFGTPDLLGYNKNLLFFTVELKVTKGNKVNFSPHQISFHITHPHNTFILVKSLKETTYKTFSGSRILPLVASGYRLETSCLGLEACSLLLGALLDACGLQL